MKMANNKILFLASLILVSFLFSMVSVMASDSNNVTMETPGASGTLSGATAIFNCSVDAGMEAENYTRVRVYFQSASLTANTTETTATAWIMNTTDQDLNGTVDSTVVEDGTDYTFK